MQGSGQSSLNIWTAFDTETTAATRHPAFSVKVSWARNTSGSIAFATVGSTLVGSNDRIQGQLDVLTASEVFSYQDETERVTKIDYDKKLEEPLGGIAYAVGTVHFDNTSLRYTRGISDTVGTLLKPNRPSRIFTGFKLQGSNILLPTMYGLTDQPFEDKNNREAGFNCYDYVSFINDFQLESAIYQDQRTDQIIASILGDIGFSADQYSLEVGLNTIGFAWFEKGQTAGERIRRLVEAELGFFFQDEQGLLRFYNNRHYHQNQPRHWTINPEDVLQWDEDTNAQIINRCIVRANPRDVQGISVVWKDGIVEEIASGETVTIWANYLDPVTSLTTPVADLDYVANTSQDGSGTDLTGNIVIATTHLTNATKLDVTNNSGSTVFMTTLQLRGTPATVTSSIQVIADDAASQETYGVKQLEIDNDFIDEKSFAQFIANLIVDKYKSPLRRLQLTIRAAPQVQISDYISVKDPDLNTYTLYAVTGIRMTMDLGQGFIETVTLRKLTEAELAHYAIVGVSLVGGSDIVGV